MEIKTELQEQGVVEVHRVTVKRDTEKVPTNTLFLTFNTPEMPMEITVSYLKVKVALFVLNPMQCFSCNKFGHTSQCCKVAAKCQWCRKDKHEGRCEGPKLCSNYSGLHASSAQDCLVWQKEKEIQRVCVESASPFWKPDSWWKPRCQLWSLKVSPVLLPLHQARNEKCRVSDVTEVGFFGASAQDNSIFNAFLWWARISISRHSGFFHAILRRVQRQLRVQPIPPKRHPRVLLFSGSL